MPARLSPGLFPDCFVALEKWFREGVEIDLGCQSAGPKPRPDSRKVAGESGNFGQWARQQIVANWLESLGRLGGFIICISLPRLRVLSNPLGRVMLGNEALDYLRFAIGP